MKIEIKEDIFWKKYSLNNSTLYLKGYIYSHSISELADIFYKCSNSDFKEILETIDGHFAIIIVNKNYTIAAVDRVRSTPLFFSKIDGNFVITNNPQEIVNRDNFDKELDESAILELLMSGYTIGNNLIYKNLNSLRPGEFVLFEDKSYQVFKYFKYYCEAKNTNADFIDQLTDLTIKIFKKMIDCIGGRQIVVPLSAGNDSRLIVSILKELNYKNVICYSYGLSANFESETAKLIAKKLGYKFYFIPLRHLTEKAFYSSNEFKNYLKFCETYSSVPFIQSLSTIKYLRDSSLIESDAVFVNGMSGDFISGGHVHYLGDNSNKFDNLLLCKEVILDTIIKKHFNLWGKLSSNEDNIRQIKQSLWAEIESNCGSLVMSNAHAFYEYSEFIDRQSKYVIMGQRAYEFYGYEWRLPLWDNDFIDFWLQVPERLKRNQSLYLNMLNKNNFGGVWGDKHPINERKIVPKWVIPLRFLCKLPFAIFGEKGKELWHEFETIFFYFWMDNTRMMSTVKYWRVIKSIGGKPQNHVSWQVQDYIKSLKLK